MPKMIKLTIALLIAIPSTVHAESSYFEKLESIFTDSKVALDLSINCNASISSSSKDIKLKVNEKCKNVFLAEDSDESQEMNASVIPNKLINLF